MSNCPLSVGGNNLQMERRGIEANVKTAELHKDRPAHIRVQLSHSSCSRAGAEASKVSRRWRGLRLSEANTRLSEHYAVHEPSHPSISHARSWQLLDNFGFEQSRKCGRSWNSRLNHLANGELV